jgi:hypothetical protein
MLPKMTTKIKIKTLAAKKTERLRTLLPPSLGPVGV